MYSIERVVGKVNFGLDLHTLVNGAIASFPADQRWADGT